MDRHDGLRWYHSFDRRGSKKNQIKPFGARKRLYKSELVLVCQLVCASQSSELLAVSAAVGSC